MEFLSINPIITPAQDFSSFLDNLVSEAGLTEPIKNIDQFPEKIHFQGFSYNQKAVTDTSKLWIKAQEKINKDVFDDVSRIVSFISVDGASNAALIQNEFITSFPQVDALSIQRL